MMNKMNNSSTKYRPVQHDRFFILSYKIKIGGIFIKRILGGWKARHFAPVYIFVGEHFIFHHGLSCFLLCVSFFDAVFEKTTLPSASRQPTPL